MYLSIVSLLRRICVTFKTFTLNMGTVYIPHSLYVYFASKIDSFCFATCDN